MDESASRAFSFLVVALRQRNLRSHSQDMRLGSGLVLVIEADRAIRAEVIGVARFGGMTSFDSVGSSAGDHFTLAIDYQINFFRGLMMVRKVRTSRRKIHREKARDDI